MQYPIFYYYPLDMLFLNQPIQASLRLANLGLLERNAAKFYSVR